MRYFANLRYAGPVRQGQDCQSIGVLEAPDEPMFIGEATCVGQDENGLAVWVLSIGGLPIEGRWVIVDREFRPAG